MQTATIQVRYVNPPKTPKGPGSVKDANGTYWKVWKDDLAKFQEGGTYQVGFETEQYQGKDQYTVKAVSPAGAQQATQQVPQPSPTPAGTPSPAPIGHNRNGTDAATAERIFVCGIVNQGIAAGQVKVAATDIAMAVNAARDAYRLTFGKE